jgi:dihydrofolate reductase
MPAHAADFGFGECKLDLPVQQRS